MEDPLAASAPGRAIEHRVERKGLRPRVAASVIATLWLVAIVIFGVVEYLVDRETFDSVWDGMWWATQTVTTVGYGDVVPADTAGRFVAAVLMIGGLSFFAVITGVITSGFVTAAQERRRAGAAEPVARKVDQLAAEIKALREEIARNDSSPTSD
jgi:voltage-gated potassium channel Kch